MIFQWFVFVLIFATAIFAEMGGQTYLVNSFGQKEIRYKWLPVLIITLPLIYWAGTRGDFAWGDTSAYRIMFRSLPSSISGLQGYLTDDIKDKGFVVVSVFLKSIIGNHDVIYFTIIAAVCLLCVVCIYKKYSCNFIMSMFLFVASADYLQWTYNGIRQFIAVAILFACTGMILRKKYGALIIIILLMSTIHASVLLMLPIIFIVQGKPWNRKTILFLFLVILSITFLDQFTNLISNIMENTQYSNEVDQFQSTEGTNMMRVVVFSIPTLLALIFRNRIKRVNNKLINLSVNMSVASFGFYLISAYTSGLFIGRLPIYFSLYNYLLLPWEIENIFNKKSARFIYIIMIILYLVFYYYQVDITWGL